MALPTAYLTSTKNLEGILNAMKAGKAPPKFTQRFLEELGFKSNPDRLVINLLKALGFLTPDGSPTQRYFEFLNQTQSGRVLAEAIEDAYADLYRVNRRAHTMPRSEIVGKIKTLTQGQASDTVVDKMAATFFALSKLADFDAPRPGVGAGDTADDAAGGVTGRVDANDGGGGGDDKSGGVPGDGAGAGEAIKLGGFVYNVELHLPDSRDPAVYDALFRSLKAHLLS
jgi:hypothetical protein